MKLDEVIVEGKNLETLMARFKKEFTPSFEYQSKSGDTKVFILEEYYFRQDSDLAIIVIFDFENSEKCRVSMAVAGGKTGLLRLDLLGAEKSMLYKIGRFFLEHAEKAKFLKKPAGFPVKVTCPACEKTIHVKEAGLCRCPLCSTVLSVSRSGSVHLARKKI